MARNVADFMSEIFNGVGGVSGVNDILNDKLGKNENAVSATKLKTARSIKTNLASESATNFDGTGNITIGVDGILPASHGGTGVSNLQNLNVGFATTASVAATSNFATRADQDCDGNKISTTYLKTGGTVAAANKLATARAFQTNLASTAAANFDGTANNTHGVTGTLGVANGGTGQTSLANVSVGSATKLATARTFQTNLASTTAANFDGTANNTHGVTGTLPVANGGTGQTSLANVTVGAASKATLDGAGNNIADTYVKKSGDIVNNIIFENWIETAPTDYRPAIYALHENRGIGLYDLNLYLQTNANTVNDPCYFKLCDNRSMFSHEPIAVIHSPGSNTKYEFKSDGIYLNGTKITN